MKEYLALCFQSEFNTQPKLKEWKVRDSQKIDQGQALFIYGEGANQREFISPVMGDFKACLVKEGESLEKNLFVGIVQVETALAQQCEQDGKGKILTPEEAKGGMEHAEAATIRLP